MHISSRHCLAVLLVALPILTDLPADLTPLTVERQIQPSPVTSHPRLWVTADDLPRLRGWATERQPLYDEGLAPLAEEMKAEVDAGLVPSGDGGSYLWEEYPAESYAELFAFMSLIDPDEDARQNYAQRSRSLLMHVINEAAKGPADDAPFRDPEFATSDRSRWWGEAFGLTVDWIYPILTVEDKATIRSVFLRWAKEIQDAGYHRPGYEDDSLIGVVNDPVL